MTEIIEEFQDKIKCVKCGMEYRYFQWPFDICDECKKKIKEKIKIDIYSNIQSQLIEKKCDENVLLNLKPDCKYQSFKIEFRKFSDSRKIFAIWMHEFESKELDGFLKEKDIDRVKRYYKKLKVEFSKKSIPSYIYVDFLKGSRIFIQHRMNLKKIREKQDKIRKTLMDRIGHYLFTHDFDTKGFKQSGKIDDEIKIEITLVPKNKFSF